MKLDKRTTLRVYVFNINMKYMHLHASSFKEHLANGRYAYYKAFDHDPQKHIFYSLPSSEFRVMMKSFSAVEEKR